MIIIGLGNPGKRYERTRHNLGFMALDAFKEAHAPDASWNFDKKLNAELAEVQINTEKIILFKPMTQMNLSGRAVKKFLNYRKLTAADMVLVYDDIDLTFGRMKIAVGGGTAGHNGVKSVMKEVNTPEFTRLRLGIQNRFYGRIPTEKFVLQPFGIFEKSKVKKWLPQIAEAIECLIKEDEQTCMNRFH